MAEANLDLFKSQEELEIFLKYTEKYVTDDYFKQFNFKTTEELDEHIKYMNSRQFIDDILEKHKRGELK